MGAGRQPSSFSRSIKCIFVAKSAAAGNVWDNVSGTVTNAYASLTPAQKQQIAAAQQAANNAVYHGSAAAVAGGIKAAKYSSAVAAHAYDTVFKPAFAGAVQGAFFGAY